MRIRQSTFGFSLSILECMGPIVCMDHGQAMMVLIRHIRCVLHVKGILIHYIATIQTVLIHLQCRIPSYTICPSNLHFSVGNLLLFFVKAHMKMLTTWWSTKSESKFRNFQLKMICLKKEWHLLSKLKEKITLYQNYSDQY